MFTLLLSMGIKILLRSVGSDSIFSANDADDLLPLNFRDFRWLVIQLNENAVKLPHCLFEVVFQKHKGIVNG